MGDRLTFAQRTARVAEGVARVQTRVWWLFVLAGFSAALVMGRTARGLSVRGGLEAVLGPRASTVRDLRAQERLLASGGILAVAVEGTDAIAMERFAQELADAMRGLPTDLVHDVDDGVADERVFVERHPFHFADLADVRRLRDGLQERLDRARLRQNPFAPPPTASIAKVVDLRRTLGTRLRALEEYPGDRYVSDDGRLRAMVVRAAAGADRDAFVGAVETVVARLRPERRVPPVRVTLVGDPVASRAEEAVVARDLRRASLLASGLVLMVLYLFFFRLRAILLLAVTFGTAAAWTLGLARLLFGDLSAATAILAPVVLFHGLTGSIAVLARWVEERREGTSVERSLALTQRGVLAATATATGASVAAYAALAFSDLRGYRDFGLLGIAGMSASWIAAHFFLPPLLVGVERVWPLVRPGRRARMAFFGAPFAWIAGRVPKVLAWLGVLLFVSAAGVSARWLLAGPVEKDVGALGPTSWNAAMRPVEDRVARAFRGRGKPLLEVAASSPQDARAFAERVARARLPGSDEPLTGPVLAASSFLPADQEEKLAVYEEIRSLAVTLGRIGSQEEKEGVMGAIPPEDLEKLALRDLPPALASRFEDREGHPGVVVQVGVGEGIARSPRAVPYLSTLADALRSVAIPGGRVVRSAGPPLLVAALHDAFREEAPKLVGWALGLVVLVTLFAFRKGRLALVSTGTLLGGVAIMLAVAAVRGEHLQPLSILALPVTFGVGVDYAVHLVRRYVEEGGRTSGPVLRETGSVVVVTSVTTMAAYLGLVPADHGALAAFGRLATYGEIACLCAALLVLPALLQAVPRRTLMPPSAG